MRPVIVNDAPQVRPWRATAADKASSARTRLELHERSSSQPVRAKKPPPPSAHPRHAPARVDRRGRPSAPPPLRRARRARAAAAAAAAPSRLLATAAALPRATTLSPSPDAPGADGTPAKAEQRPPGRPLLRLPRARRLRSSSAVRRREAWRRGKARPQQNWPQEFGLGAMPELIVKTPNTKRFRRQA